MIKAIDNLKINWDLLHKGTIRDAQGPEDESFKLVIVTAIPESFDFGHCWIRLEMPAAITSKKRPQIVSYSFGYYLDGNISSPEPQELVNRPRKETALKIPTSSIVKVIKIIQEYKAACCENKVVDGNLLRLFKAIRKGTCAEFVAKIVAIAEPEILKTCRSDSTRNLFRNAMIPDEVLDSKPDMLSPLGTWETVGTILGAVVNGLPSYVLKWQEEQEAAKAMPQQIEPQKAQSVSWG